MSINKELIQLNLIELIGDVDDEKYIKNIVENFSDFIHKSKFKQPKQPKQHKESKESKQSKQPKGSKESKSTNLTDKKIKYAFSTRLDSTQYKKLWGFLEERYGVQYNLVENRFDDEYLLSIFKLIYPFSSVYDYKYTKLLNQKNKYILYFKNTKREFGFNTIQTQKLQSKISRVYRFIYEIELYLQN